MASRRDLKEKRRREREEAERRDQEALRRRRRLWIASASAAAVAAGAAGLFSLGVFDEDPADAFAAKPDGLVERVQKSGLTAGGDHIHPTVRVVVEGAPIPIPADIGVSAGGRPGAPIHLHEGDETLHAEGVQAGTLTLGQFLAVWGVPASPTRLGPYRETAARRVSIFVKAKGDDRFTETDEVSDVPLDDGDEIYLVYGTPAQSPITL